MLLHARAFFVATVAGVNAPVLAAVAAQQQQTAQAVLTYENMSLEQIRRELNIPAPTRNVRRVEAVLAYKRIMRVAATPAAQKAVLKWLTPQPRQGGASNNFPFYYSDKLTYGTMQVLLHEVHVSGVVPEIFRNWTAVSSTDPSVRHAALVSNIKRNRHH